MVESCRKCSHYLPSQAPEFLVQEDKPTRPFEIVAVDLFSYYSFKEYFVYSDRYSGFHLVTKYGSTPTASNIIQDLMKYFALMGVPNILCSDNGPQFSASITQVFLKEWGVKWRPSSPFHSQSNGHAESMVKIIKRLLARLAVTSIPKSLLMAYSNFEILKTDCHLQNDCLDTFYIPSYLRILEIIFQNPHPTQRLVIKERMQMITHKNFIMTDLQRIFAD